MGGCCIQGARSQELAALIRERVQYCIQQHRALNVRTAMEGLMPLLRSLTSVRKSKGKQEGAPRSEADSWQTQLLLAFQLLMVATGALSP